MGQRFQSVFILPPVYMNEENPNNRQEKVLIFHNQWLYGYSALKTNLLIIKRLKKAFNKYKECGSFSTTKKEFINHFLENCLLNTIDYAGCQGLFYSNHFSKSGEFCYTDKINQYSLSDELLKQDNNNGFFICIIDKNLKIKYSFINGLEDEDTFKLKTPSEYLSLFYNEDSLKEFGEKGLKEIHKTIISFNKFDKIENNNLKPIIDKMNKPILEN